jgi:hypothetical protein
MTSQASLDTFLKGIKLGSYLKILPISWNEKGQKLEYWFESEESQRALPKSNSNLEKRRWALYSFSYYKWLLWYSFIIGSRSAFVGFITYSLLSSEPRVSPMELILSILHMSMVLLGLVIHVLLLTSTEQLVRHANFILTFNIKMGKAGM